MIEGLKTYKPELKPSKSDKRLQSYGHSKFCMFSYSHFLMPMSSGYIYHQADPQSAGPEVLSINMCTSCPSRLLKDPYDKSTQCGLWQSTGGNDG